MKPDVGQQRKNYEHRRKRGLVLLIRPSYFEGLHMITYTKDSARRILICAAKKYDTYLNNKNFLIIYSEERRIQRRTKLQFSEISFSDYHFQHLTGIIYQNKLLNIQKNDGKRKAHEEFFRSCVTETLSHNEFDFKDITTHKKLEVLEEAVQFRNLLECGYVVPKYRQLKTDFAVGNNRYTFGFQSVQKGNFQKVLPNTLLKESIKHSANPRFHIQAVLRKEQGDPFYDTCIFAKEDLSKIKNLLPAAPLDKTLKMP